MRSKMNGLKDPTINGVVLPGKEIIICIVRLDQPLGAGQCELPFKALFARNSQLLRRRATQKPFILGARYEFRIDQRFHKPLLQAC